MREINYIITDGKNKDFVSLCQMLDDYLNELVGGEEKRQEYIPHNKLDDICDVVLAYYGEEPVGCVAFKHYADGIAEVKRVFVKRRSRGYGIAKELMSRLELLAKHKGYNKCILETGKPLGEAMKLYHNMGYKVIPNYEPYTEMEASICMEKSMKMLAEMTLKELWQLFPIILKKHNPEYKQWYTEEINKIGKAVGEENIFRISHIGSTAVAGLMAKPIVDILLEISEQCDAKQIKQEIQSAGWICMSESDEPHLKISFNKGYTEQGFAKKVFHLHLRKAGDCDELYFRDYLIANPDVAKQYADRKQQLKVKFEHDREAYTQAKSEFIHKHTNIAKKAWCGRYDKK